MTFELPKLPYEMDALSPHMSTETLNYHYGKHHQTYVNNLNRLIEGTQMKTQSLETIVKNSTGPLFNNAAQVWNHTFFWQSLSPEGGNPPTEGLLYTLLCDAFGDIDNFCGKFSEVAINTFGSGWAWLVLDQEKNKLEIISTSNAATPLTQTHITPLLTCDVWEHAYYIDHRNRRPDYLKAFWALCNWAFAEKNLAATNK